MLNSFQKLLTKWSCEKPATREDCFASQKHYHKANFMSVLDTKKVRSWLKTLFLNAWFVDCCIGKPLRFDLKPTLALSGTCPSTQLSLPHPCLNSNPNPTATVPSQIVLIGLRLSHQVQNLSGMPSRPTFILQLDKKPGFCAHVMLVCTWPAVITSDNFKKNTL